VKHL